MSDERYSYVSRGENNTGELQFVIDQRRLTVTITDQEGSKRFIFSMHGARHFFEAARDAQRIFERHIHR